MSTKDISEADCWFVIGAYQAGATEKECSDLSGLSRSSAHSIISNFKKLGSPHASALSMNTLLTQSPKKRTRKKDDDDCQPRKRGRPRKPTQEPFFTQSLIRKVLLEASNGRDQKSTINDSPKHEVERTPHDRLDTPPTDDDAIKVLLRRDSEESAYSFLPPTPRSPLELLDDEEEEWSLEDDKLLLSHVLGFKKNIKWKEAEAKMNDRHLAMNCSERWEFLKKQLLKDAQNVIE